ncbi:MAG: LLM class flavin-dependent oxidoreductase [Alphaproteobacteria bacterium]
MSIGVGVGLAQNPFGSADAYWRWVQLCEENGVDSIWQTDRLISSEPFLECMSTMAALAGATKKLKFGMNVASLALRDPLLMAKQCATIDYLSNGRLLPAFGLGSNRSRDWVATNTDTARRGKRMDEGLQILTRLWAGEKLTFKGEFYDYDEVKIAPLPVQQPLPLWIGGSSQAAFERSGKYGTGWQASFETPAEAGVAVREILAAAARHGRPMDPDHMGMGFQFRFGSWDEPIIADATEAYRKRLGRDPESAFAVGDAAAIVARIKDYADNGIAKFILRPVGADDDDLLAQTRLMVNEVMPEIAAMNAARKAAKTAAAE